MQWDANTADRAAPSFENPNWCADEMKTWTIRNGALAADIDRWCQKIFGSDNSECYEVDRGPIPWSTDFTFYGDAVETFQLTWMDKINA